MAAQHDPAGLGQPLDGDLGLQPLDLRLRDAGHVTSSKKMFPCN